MGKNKKKRQSLNFKTKENDGIRVLKPTIRKSSSIQSKSRDEHDWLIDIVKQIVEIDEKNLENVYREIMKYSHNISYIEGAIKYAMKIRPLQKKTLSLLLSRINPSKCFEEKEITPYLDGSIESAIIEDNGELFEKLIKNTDFNSYDTVNLFKDDPIYFVDCDEDNEVSYMQFMAFYGYADCFQRSINIFDKEGEKNNGCIAKYALAGGNIEIIDILINRGVSFDNCFKVAIKYHRHLLWMEHLKNYKREEVYLSRTQDYYNDWAFIYIDKDCNKDSTMLKALKKGNLLVIKELGIDIDKKFFWKTPLCIAIENNHLDVIKYLIQEKGESIEEDSYKKQKPLLIAIKNGNLNIIKFLVEECKADINVISDKYLVDLINDSNLKVFKYIFNKIMVKMREDKSGKVIPTCVAAQRGNLEIFKFLVEKREHKSYEKAKTYEKELYIASENGHFSIMKYLIEECHESVENVSSNALHVAVGHHNFEAIKYLVEKCKIDVNSTDLYKRTPLFIATSNYSSDEDFYIIKYLAEICKADVKRRHSFKRTLLHIATEKGVLKLVKYFIEVHGIDKGLEDKNEETALSIAKRKKYFDIIDYLTKKPKVTKKEAMIHKAIDEFKFDAFKTMVKEFYYVIPPSLLTYAAEKENFDVFKYIIENYDVDINICDRFERTVLSIAIEKENIKMIKYIIGLFNGNKKDLRTFTGLSDIYGRTPLHIAAQKGNVEIIKMLIRDCDAEFKKDVNYKTPIFYALESGKSNIEMLKLLDHFDSKSIDFDEKTPLHVAIEYLDAENKNDVLTIDHFCSIGRKLINQKDYYDKTPLTIATEKGNFYNIKYLDCNSNEFSNMSRLALHTAAYKNNYTLVKYLMDKYVKTDILMEKDKYGRTPLHIAAQFSSLQIVKFLLSKYKKMEEKGKKASKKDIILPVLKEKDVFGRTPLYLACLSGNKDNVTLLFTNNYSSVDKKGKTILMAAAKSRNKELIKYLALKCDKSYIEKRDNKGKTIFSILSQEKDTEKCKENIELTKMLTTKCGHEIPLFYAIEREDLQLMTNLVDNCKEELSVRDRRGKTVMHFACIKNNLTFIKYLINNCKLNKEIKDDDGKTPLFWACNNGSKTLIESLIEECQMNENAVDNENKTILHTACVKNKLDVIQYLIEERQLYINAKDKYEKTILHIACAKNSLDVVKYLINECMLDINAEDSEKKTPLHYACANSVNPDIVEFLINDCNADQEVVDKEGRTALHIACIKNNTKCIKYLIHSNKKYQKELINIGEDALVKKLTKEYTKKEELIYETKIKNSFAKERKKFEEDFPLAVSNKDLTSMKCLLDEYRKSIDKINKGGKNKKKKEEENNKLNEIGQISFYIAIKNGDIKVIEFIARNFEIDANLPDSEEGKTALQIACSTKNIDIFYYLINEMNAKLDKEDPSPVYFAIERNDKNLLTFLFDKNISYKDVIDKKGRTLLHIACRKCNLDIIRYLVEDCYLNKETVDRLERTPLCYAIKNCNTDVVNYLINDCNANVRRKDSFGRTIALNIAITKGSYSILKILLRKLEKNEEIINECLLISCRNGNEKIFKEFSVMCNDIFEIMDTNGETIIHLAVRSCNLNFIKYILELENGKPHINLQSKEGKTAFYIAVEMRNIRITKYFIENKADVNIRDNNGKTPFQVACESGSYDIIKILGSLGSSVILETVDAFGETPLHSAVKGGSIKVIRYLKGKINPKIRNNNNKTALDIANDEGMSYVVDTLKEKY